jgi:hypothetical protein
MAKAEQVFALLVRLTVLVVLLDMPIRFSETQ